MAHTNIAHKKQTQQIKNIENMTKNKNNKNLTKSISILKILFAFLIASIPLAISCTAWASNVINMSADEENGVSEEAPIGETEDIIGQHINVNKRRGDKASADAITIETAQYGDNVITGNQTETQEILIETTAKMNVVRSIQGGGNDNAANYANEGELAETLPIVIESEVYDFSNNIVAKPKETTAPDPESESAAAATEPKSGKIEGVVTAVAGRKDENLIAVSTEEIVETTKKETEYTGPRSASIVKASLSEAVYVQQEGENQGFLGQLGTMIMQLFDNSGPTSVTETSANIQDFSLIQEIVPMPGTEETRVTKVKRQRLLTLEEQSAILAAQGIATEIKDFPDPATGQWVKAPAVWDTTSNMWVRAAIDPVFEYEEEVVETGAPINMASNTGNQSAPGGILGIKHVGEVDPLKYIELNYQKSPEILLRERTGFDPSELPKGLFQYEDDLYYILSGGVLATEYFYTTQEGDRLYFGEDGKQVKNEKIELNGEYYYLDHTGVMVKDQFVYIREETDSGDTMVFQPYFFGPGGKAYKAPAGRGTVVKQIGDDKFVFDEYGRACYGYVAQDGTILDANEQPAYEDCMYYCGDISFPAVETGWHFYDKFKEDEYDDGKDMWLYFSPTTGKKVYQTGLKVKMEIIDGQRYGFDEYGVLVNGWTKGSTDGKKYFDYEGDGSLVINGWISAVPGENSILERNQKHHTDGVECWYYISRGAPLTKRVRKINGHKYCFDDDGVMQYGFCIIQGDEYIATLDPEGTGQLSSEDFIYANTEMCTMTEGQRIMFFDDPTIPEEHEDDPYYTALSGAAVEGKEITISLSDGDFKFYADNKGGVVGKTITTPTQRGGKYYQNGILLAPLEGRKYGIIREGDDKVDSDGNHTYIVVDKNGKPVKDTKVLSEGGKNGNYIVVQSGKYRAMYTAPVRHNNQGWWYKEEGKWILVPNNEMPQNEKVYDLEGYLLNTEEYDGPD